MVIKQIAEAGIFNQPDKTPMKSTELANLYEALQYIAATIAQEYDTNRDQ